MVLLHNALAVAGLLLLLSQRELQYRLKDTHSRQGCARAELIVSYLSPNFSVQELFSRHSAFLPAVSKASLLTLFSGCHPQIVRPVPLVCSIPLGKRCHFTTGQILSMS